MKKREWMAVSNAAVLNFRTPGRLIKGLLPDAMPEIVSLINAGAVRAITQSLGLKDQEQN